MQCRNGKVTQGWESHGLALEPWDMKSLQHGDWECGRNSSAIYLSLETSLWRTDQKSFLKQRRDQWMKWFWRLFFCRCPSSHFLVNICTWTTHWVSNARCLKENCLPLPIGSSSGLHFCPCYSNPGQVLSQSLAHALLFLPNSSSPDNILLILSQWSFVCVLLRGFVLGSGITMPSTLVCCSQDGFACCWCTEEGRPVAKVVWKCFTEGSRGALWGAFIGWRRQGHRHKGLCLPLVFCQPTPSSPTRLSFSSRSSLKTLGLHLKLSAISTTSVSPAFSPTAFFYDYLALSQSCCGILMGMPSLSCYWHCTHHPSRNGTCHLCVPHHHHTFIRCSRVFPPQSTLRFQYFLCFCFPSISNSLGVNQTPSSFWMHFSEDPVR